MWKYEGERLEYVATHMVNRPECVFKILLLVTAYCLTLAEGSNYRLHLLILSNSDNTKVAGNETNVITWTRRGLIVDPLICGIFKV